MPDIDALEARCDALLREFEAAEEEDREDRLLYHDAWLEAEADLRKLKETPPCPPN